MSDLDDDDDLTRLAVRHPALRIIVGLIILFNIWTIYVLLYPQYIQIVNSLTNIIPNLPNFMSNGPIPLSGFSTIVSPLTQMLGAAFIIAFSGVIFFFLIVPAITRG